MRRPTSENIPEDAEEPKRGDLLGELREIFEDVSQEFADRSTPKERKVTRREEVNRAEKAVAAKSAKVATPVEFGASKEAEEVPNLGANIAEEFDLRKAVIMSEILTRKYDE